MKDVYSRLKDYCRNRHGLDFQLVDMRWGVRDEATDDHITTDLCLKEIELCQKISVGPNFVVSNYILQSILFLISSRYPGQSPISSFIYSWHFITIADYLVCASTSISTYDIFC